MFGILTVTAGPDKDRTLTLVRGEVLTLGNDAKLVDKLNDPLISRQHCRIVMDEGSALLTDCNSSTGTQVNGKTVASHVLQSGDVIHIGYTKLVFEWTDGDEGSTGTYSIPPGE
jgi:pSer/pThr/pTyr-binding forkhead associated (FHA) protein